MRLRRSIVPLGIFVVALIGAVIGWKIYWPIESSRYGATKAVLKTRSEIRMTYAVEHARGPVAREQLTFTNDDGIAKVAYEGTNRSGTLIARFTADVDGYDVSSLFGKAVQDGIWELQTKPPRGDTSQTYTIGVYQLTDNQSGSHSFTFTDPHYWETTGGRQYEIHLDKNQPVPDLVKLRSTSTSEPRYRELVDDFRSFGSSEFRATLEAARAKLRDV